MKVLVTGAGGKTGRAVIAALVRRALAVRPFLRRNIAIPNTHPPVVGDMTNSDDWNQAMSGIDAVYHICPNMHPAEVEIGRLAIAAAQRAGVTRFVYHSVLHPQIEAMPHHWHKMRVEEMLLESQLAFTILQPTAYMQNIKANWQAIKETGKYVVPYPVSSRISLVDLRDVAAAAAQVLAEDGHAGAIYELVGTRPLSQVEVAEVLGEVYGRAITAHEIDLQEWQENAQAAGLPPHASDTLLKMFRHYAAHGLAGNPNILRWLLQRDPTSLFDCVQRWK
jgi:uncharacterized protein YbjT (DUF2867 family)